MDETVDDTRVREAIERTRRLMPQHWRHCLEAHTGGQDARYWSFGDATDDEIADCLLEGGWRKFVHPLIEAPPMGSVHPSADWYGRPCWQTRILMRR